MKTPKAGNQRRNGSPEEETSMNIGISIGGIILIIILVILLT